MSAADMAANREAEKSKRTFGLFCCRGGGKAYEPVRQPKTQWESRRGVPLSEETICHHQQSASADQNASCQLSPGSLTLATAKPTTRANEETEDVVASVRSDVKLAAYPHLTPDDLRELMSLHDQFKGPLLGPQKSSERGKKTLVLDLDETLVHSSFQPVAIAAFVIPVEIETLVYEIYVAKRPGVDEFLSFCAELYEVVIFTASLGKVGNFLQASDAQMLQYAGPLLDKIDPDKKCPWRLYRDACLLWQGNYVKDLSKLGRDLKDVLIVDNSPASSILQPDNAIPIRSWFDDPEDRELFELMPILRALSRVEDIQAVIRRTATCESDDDDDSNYGF